MTLLHALGEGSVLQIPHRVASSLNDAQTFKVYNKSEMTATTAI